MLVYFENEKDRCSTMKILVINAGSSSIKYQLFDMENETVMAKGLCDRIGIAGGNFKHAVPGKDDYKVEVQMANHGEAIQLVIDALTSADHGVGNCTGFEAVILRIVTHDRPEVDAG